MKKINKQRKQRFGGERKGLKRGVENGVILNSKGSKNSMDCLCCWLLENEGVLKREDLKKGEDGVSKLGVDNGVGASNAGVVDGVLKQALLISE